MDIENERIAQGRSDDTKKLKADNKHLRGLVGCLDKLLVSYRMGTSPSEKTLDGIQKHRQALKDG